MSVPTWEGDEHTLGTFRYRVLWFRVLLIAGVSTGLVGAFGLGHSHGQRSAEAAPPTRAAASLSPAATTARLDAATPSLEGSGTIEYTDFCDEDETEAKPLTQAEERALQDQARERCLRVEAARAAREARSQAVSAQLESGTISLDFDATPIEEAFDYLRDLTKLNYVVTRDARDLIETESVEVSLRLKEISQINALKLILASHEDLTFRIRDGVILILNGEAARDHELQAYAVEDIVSGRLQGKGGASLSPEALVELIEEDLFQYQLCFEGTVEYTSGSAGQRGTLLARIEPREHLRVRKLLSYLRNPKPVASSEPMWVAHYRTALESRRVTLSFSQAPLSEVVAFLEDITGLNLTIAGGVDADALEVTIRLREVALGDALRLVLEQCELAQSFVYETLLIHEASDSSHTRYALAVIDVRDLSTWMDSDQIEELVLNGVGEDHWDEPASLQVHRGQLLVRQTAARQEKIRELLAKLRFSRAQSATKTK